jgi:hypothetical protein
MGFSFKNPFKKAKNLFSGVGKSVESFGNWLDVTKPGGFGDILTFGSISQAEAVKESKKARDQAASQYAEQTAAAEAEAKRIAELEEERKRKLLLYGTAKPSTMVGGYLGLGGQATTSRPSLG